MNLTCRIIVFCGSAISEFCLSIHSLLFPFLLFAALSDWLLQFSGRRRLLAFPFLLFNQFASAALKELGFLRAAGGFL